MKKQHDFGYNFAKVNTGEKITQFRLSILMTQREFAKELGVSFVTVNRWETGKARPTLNSIRKIASLMDKKERVKLTLED